MRWGREAFWAGVLGEPGGLGILATCRGQISFPLSCCFPWQMSVWGVWGGGGAFQLFSSAARL